MAWNDNRDALHVILVGRLQEECPHLELVGAGRKVAIAHGARLVGVLPVLLVSLQFILIVDAVLELVVESGETY